MAAGTQQNSSLDATRLKQMYLGGMWHAATGAIDWRIINPATVDMLGIERGAGIDQVTAAAKARRLSCPHGRRRQARAQELAKLRHPRETANAPPNWVNLLMQDMHTAALHLGIAGAVPGAGCDPNVNARVYHRVLQYRHASVLAIEGHLPMRGSAYEFDVAQQELSPDAAEVDRILAIVNAVQPAIIERSAARWFTSE